MAAAPVRDSGPAAKETRSDNRPGPLTERQNARRKAAQELILSGTASPNQDGVVQLADDKYFEAAVTGTGRVFTILSEFGDQGSGKLGRDPGPLHNEIPSQTAAQMSRSTTARTGSTISARTTTRTSSSAPANRSPTSTRSSPPATTRSQARSRTGSRCLATRRPTGTTPSRTSAAPRISSRTRAMPGTRRSSTRVARSTTSRPSSRRSTSGIATTTTTTATSTSRMATSTTSRRSTPVRARMPAAEPRAPMPSGHSARTPTRPTTW